MTREDELRVRQIFREEMARMSSVTDCGVMEEPETPVTPKSRFVGILSDINHRKWAVVVEVASDTLVQELMVSPETLSYDEHKRLEDILLLDADAPFRTAPRTCKEIGKLLHAAKNASYDAALRQASVPAKPMSDGGKKRADIFREEAERKRECAEAGVLWEPLAENAWAFRRP